MFRSSTWRKFPLSKCGQGAEYKQVLRTTPTLSQTRSRRVRAVLRMSLRRLPSEICVSLASQPDERPGLGWLPSAPPASTSAKLSKRLRALSPETLKMRLFLLLKLELKDAFKIILSLPLT